MLRLRQALLMNEVFLFLGIVAKELTALVVGPQRMRVWLTHNLVPSERSQGTKCCAAGGGQTASR